MKHILNGHKTQVMAIINLIVMFLAGRGIIQSDAVDMIFGVSLILTGGAIAYGEVKKKQSPSPLPAHPAQRTTTDPVRQ